MVRVSVLNDGLKTMYNAEKRGKRQVLLRPSSKVVIKFLQVMQRHGESRIDVCGRLLPHHSAARAPSPFRTIVRWTFTMSCAQARAGANVHAHSVPPSQ